MSQTNYPFNPIMGSEKIILQQEPHTGALYFTTDTRKIYFDADGSGVKMPMGGNIGLFYGNMKLTVPAIDGQKEFGFAITDIIGNEDGIDILQPNVNDLILNSDGCFYKVLSSSGSGLDLRLNTEKLTIAGTGGNGNNNNNDPSTGSLAGFSVSRLIFDYTSILYQKACPVRFAAKLTDDLGDYVTNNVGTYILYVNGVEKDSGPIKGISSGDTGDLTTINPTEFTEIDVGPYLQLRKDNTIVIQINGSNGGSYTRGGSVAVTNMALEWKYNETTVNHWITEGSNKIESMTLEWSVSGADLQKETWMSINEEEPILIGKGTKKEYSYVLNFAERNLSHGAHSIKMWATTTVGGGTTSTDPIYKNIIIAKDNDSSTIISMGLFTKELTQYNTIKIPICIYNPQNVSGTAEIELFENGESKDKWTNVQNLVMKDWAYTPTVPSNSMILTVQSGGREKSITVVVNPIDVTINEKPGYAFKFKATDFSSNENIKNWGTDTCGISFSEKFDWINGGLQTEEDGQGGHRQYVAIKAGSSMTIDYDMWAKNAPGYGKHLKVIFKATNCRDYDAQVLSSLTPRRIIYTDVSIEHYLLTEEVTTLTYSSNIGMNGYEVVLLEPKEAELSAEVESSRKLFQDAYVKFGNDVYRCNFIKETLEDETEFYYAVWYKTTVQDSFWGLSMKAQNATFNSNNASVVTQYCEDNYIEFEFEVTQEVSGKPYIKFWIDGIPSNYVKYSTSDRFLGDNKIVIGSPDCDVYIYLIKLYDDELSVDEHMDNFYADAPNAEEMVKRYRRNDIMDDERDNEISPYKLAMANPDCLVHIYDIPRIPTTKKDEVFPCKYEQYHASKTAKLTADGVMIKVQGTSSEKYVVAAANLDTDFNFTDKGNVPSGIRDVASGKILTDGWSMDGGKAIPVDFFCTKVNVASCENANNALNQEWYNLFQPYKSVLRCKKPNARDTMQFTNGVLFMVDHNDVFNTAADAEKKGNNVFGEIDGYMADPYPKMYSLGQMGNSKDNVHVFHDQENPLECCVEVRDNQTPQQWMVDFNYNHADIGEKEKLFEFRYPDGASEASEDMINGWNRLVRWFAESNPSPKYEKHENITTLTQYKDFSINKKTFQPIPVFVMKEDESGYEEIFAFDENISTYYTATPHIYGHTNCKLPEPVTFEPYMFSGFIAQAQKDKDNKLWQKDYTPMISGCTVNQYAGTYEYDTYNYRMAKMLQECEDYLIMDSVLYHFLFIERHCMVDNVAKNTFWSTEDCRHWSLIKDYDNDTADGNDNNGKFTRTYGMEPMDRLNQNAYVFNAHQSVWFNFVNGLKEACDWMYQELENAKQDYNGESISVWDSKAYLKAFNKWQSMIPERCWIEDYYRKYFRPSELYNDDMFVEMMEGGQKKYQRTQYETYEDIYMASKYNGSEYLKSEIRFRPTGDNVKGLKLPLTVYSDCYVRMDLGSDTSKERVKRNTVVYVTCPTNNLNNATMYLYPSKLFTTIGDVNGGQVGHFAPDQGSFAGAPKLRELVFATSNNTTLNTGMTGGLNFSANPLLEKLYIANLLSYNNELNLSGCPSLVEVDATNSAFTGITIADGAPTQKIVLNNPSSLYLSDLHELQELNIKSYNRLNTLTLNNIDNDKIKTKNLVKTVLNALSGSDQKLAYKLNNVKWNFDSSSEIPNNRITLLDDLLNLNKSETTYKPGKKEQYPYSAALTGVVDITADAYSASSANALEMHDYYVNADKFAELNMQFESENSLLYDVIIYNGDGVEVWRRKTVPGTTITEEFLMTGPEGSFESSSLEKSPTAEYVFTFLQTWKVKNDDGEIIGTINAAEPTGSVVNSNIHLYPDFIQSSRYYPVVLKSKHPATKVVETLLSREYPFGTDINTIANDLGMVPYADSSKLNLLEVYDFMGYSLVENSSTLISSKFKVNGPTTLWAVFELATDARKVVHPEWFDVEYADITESRLDVYGVEGVRLIPKYVLKGKITIPSYVMYEGIETPVIEIKSFGGADQNSISPHAITHVFMDGTSQKPNQLYSIAEFCFYNSVNLQYFDFEYCAVRQIGIRGFAMCPNLKYTGTFGNNLQLVGGNAFNQSLTADGPIVLRIPSSVIAIPTLGFSYLKIPAGSSLEIGTEENPSKLDLAGSTNPFIMNPDNKYTNVVFYSDLYDENEQLVFDRLSSATNGSITIY